MLMANHHRHAVQRGLAQRFSFPLPVQLVTTRGRLAIAGLLLAAWFVGVKSAMGQSAAGSASATGQDLGELGLEELANLPVTSVSKKPEKLSQAPAAIAVITQDDIHRSGVTTIAEALRMVPGLEVARGDSHNWAISARIRQWN